ncbi:MAG: type II secretion system protein GspD [Sphingomonadales bacterium 32-68-7]|nr:MAG: type II secretion system protein GspD [Sphingomonadales bacterium 12-68-11]OYX10638.1 MAG: type II secretion system protein GspD [Sphingomonadales bacterium 32-68-7]
MTLFRRAIGPGLLLLVPAGCATPQAPQPIESAETAPSGPESLEPEPAVRATIVAGEAPVPAPPQSVQFQPDSGNISLNFPASDVRVVAKATLGDILRVPFTVSPDATASVAVVTPMPIARSSLIPFLEDALRASGLALIAQNGGYAIMPLASARSSGVVGSAAVGYSTEVIRLEFVAAAEIRKLLDSVVPGTVTAVDPVSNSITIAGTSGQRSSARELLKQFDVNWLRNMSFALFVTERTDSRLIVPELDKLINAPNAPTQGLIRIIAMDRLNGILAVSAQPQYLDDVRRWIEILDREGEGSQRRLFVYHVQNGRSRDLARTLNVAFGRRGDSGGQSANTDPFAPAEEASPASANPPASAALAAAASPGAAPGDPADGDVIEGTISSDDVNNAIIVYSTPREYALIEDALRQLDVLPYQVLIEAAITEVTLTDTLRYGVQWNFQSGDANFALGEGEGANPIRFFPGFSFFIAPENDISATLNALERRTNIKVVSAPKLLVLNNQTAALQVGDQVPISVQSSVGVQNPDSPIVSSIEYRDTGVILKVTPRVNRGGLVLLDIAQEVSDVAQNTTSDISSPVISTRRISTSIAVQDGQVIALGGLFRESKNLGNSGIPLLSRIPIIGAFLFGNNSDVSNRTELLVILKPTVLRTIDDGRAITEELRSKIRTLEPFRTQGRIP